MIAMFGLGGILGILMLLVVGGFALLVTVFWIWMLIDAITNRGLTDIEKLIWVLVILFIHFIGALLYLLIGRSKRPGLAA